MLKILLPRSSRVRRGKSYKINKIKKKTFSVYRYNPTEESAPQMVEYELSEKDAGKTVLDALIHIKDNIDPTLSFRKSCREGSCGSCAMNINGMNCLACTTKNSKKNKILPMPHMKIIRDLVCDLKAFFDQYKRIKPWLKSKIAPKKGQENLQSPEQREKLNGIYECILCACCSTRCPSYWWNEEKFIGPANFLQISRWVKDSRDDSAKERIQELEDKMSINDCHKIFSCTLTCPKKLNPAEEISQLKQSLNNINNLHK